MTYIRYFVPAPLNAYINNFYYLDGHMPYLREKILPLPVSDLKINLGGALQVYETEQLERSEALVESWWVGLWTKYHTVEWPQNTQLFGVSFKPGGAYPFLQLPLSELHNRVVSLDTLWGDFAVEIRERLYAASTLEKRFALLEQLLCSRLSEAPNGFDMVQNAITEITQHHGALSIGELSDHIGVSQNYLGMQFKRMVGVPPKELARLARFDHVLHSIDVTKPVDWTFIAHEAHYYDQSHFNKDFVAFTGQNPTDYLRLRRQIQSENPSHNQLRRNLPTD